MSTLAVEPSCSLAPLFHPTTEQKIRECVQTVFQLFRPRSISADRRQDRREPFPYPIHITPVARDGSAKNRETFVVLGKHLSERGLDFYYEAPLPHRRVITSWKDSDGNWLAILLDLRWCRLNQHGWYENGGRFLRVVKSPLEEDGDTCLSK
jgi:hypothetical protein